MITLRTTFVALFFALLTNAPVQAGPPLITDDAGIVDVGAAELELSGSLPYDRETTAGVTTVSRTADAELKLSAGLHKGLSGSLAIPYTVSGRVKTDNQPASDTHGFGDMTVSLKLALFEAGGVNLAIKPAIILPTGDYQAGLSAGRWQFGATLIASREFEDGKYALHANLGYERHAYRNPQVREENRTIIWSGSIAGEARVTDSMVAVIDCGLSTNSDKGSDEVPLYLLSGLRYALNERLDVNAGIKLGLTRPEEDISLSYGLAVKL